MDGNVLLPELSMFVGRRVLLDDLRRRLGEVRQLTLTGVGGAGKTRLALALAEWVRRAYDDVRVVELARIREADLLVQTVSTAVGIPDQAAGDPLGTLLDYLRERRMLLVLDNCEHLGSGVGALVATLLRIAPELSIIVTSREMLYINGETVVPVPPLEVPPTDAPMELDRYEAVTLLAERATARVPGWAITEDNWPYVVRLLNRLGGLPLMIELAVARLRSMSIEVLVPRLDDTMRLLTRNDQTALTHHGTARAVIEWSHDLCTPIERVLWAQVSVFAGTFDLQAVEAVCASGELSELDVSDSLAGLVDKSIVMTSEDRSRYWLLDPLRQFGAEQLHEDGQQSLVAARHLDHYQKRAAVMATSWLGPDETRMLRQVSADMPNYRAAMTTAMTTTPAISDDADVALRIAVDVLARTRWCFYSGELPEARHHLQRGMAASTPRPTVLRAGALALDAWIAMCLGEDVDKVRGLVEEAVAVADEIGAPIPPVTYARGVYQLLVDADIVCVATLLASAEQFMALGPAFRGDVHMAMVLRAVGAALIADEPTARTAVAEFRNTYRAREAPWGISWALWCDGVTETRFGDAEHAHELLCESLRLQRAMGDRWGPIWGVEALAFASAYGGNARRAACMLGAAAALQKLTGVQISKLKPYAEARARAEQLAQDRLSPQDYQVAYRAGTQVDGTLDAVALALGEEQTYGPSTGSTTEQVQHLTPTQWSVARLVSAGMSNGEIAKKLVISTRTAETHVQAIYARLGLSSRVALSTWVHNHDSQR